MNWETRKLLHDYLSRRRSFYDACCRTALLRGELAIARECARIAELAAELCSMVLDD